MKNDVHTNTYTAPNISMNIVYDKGIADNNPFFNKTLDEYPESNYQTIDLFELS